MFWKNSVKSLKKKKYLKIDKNIQLSNNYNNKKKYTIR